MQVIEAGDFEIERRLESYARARLGPDPVAIARVRARVMREARLQAELPRLTILEAPTARRPGGPMTRRLSMTFLAAAVWLGISAGSLFAAQAGGPLYPARMWLEQFTLPGEPAAHAAAELTRLDARLADALAAAARGDSGAVQAALDVYGQIADEIIAAAAGNADLERLVATALDRHLAVLGDVASGLMDKGNITAAGAVAQSIARAIDHNQDVIVRLGSATPATGSVGSNGPGGGVPTNGNDDPGARKTPKPTPDDTAKPTQGSTQNKPTSEPTAKPTPDPTVRPTPKATSHSTPPERAPRGDGDN